MSRSIKWLFAMMLTLSVGIDAAAVAGGGSTKDYAWLLFLNVNEPPVVDAGMDHTITWAADSVYLDATVTDDPRDTLTYTWTKLDDPGYDGFSSPNAEDTTATLSTPGTSIFQLSVSDGKLTTMSTVAITLNNSAPDVNVGPDKQITYPTTSFFLNASVTDDPNDTLTYAWSKISGPAGGVEFSNSSSEDTNATFSVPGSYVLQLRVSDGDLPSTDRVTITYVKPNSAPQVNAGSDKTITHPTKSVFLNANVSDDGPASSLTYTWTRVSGPGSVSITNPKAEDTSINFSPGLVGTYVFEFKVSDGKLTSTDRVTVRYLSRYVMVAVGDSITVGYGDYDSCKRAVPNQNDPTIVKKYCNGYTPLLASKMRAATGHTHTIREKGTGGKTSYYGRVVMQSIVSANSYAHQYLVLYGTNDSYKTLLVPSGLGKDPGDSGYAGTFKDNMQRIINEIKKNAQPALAKVPFTKGAINAGYGRNTLIQKYNAVVDELVQKNSIGVSPPDLYTYFKNNQHQIWDVNMFDYYLGLSNPRLDNVHPGHNGYDAIANKWRNVLPH